MFISRSLFFTQHFPLQNYQIYPEFRQQLNQWRLENPVDSLSVLFVGGYFDNPASVFGHNLLKFNSKNNNLFSSTINFGAKVPSNNNAIFYIFKGLFGMYNARFTNQEFYKQDLLYSKHELRDIWEYQLNLSQDEIMLIKLHLWGIQDKQFNFFLKENCAYQIASILDLVIDMNLPEFKQWYIPVELTNQVSQFPNKIAKITYHPSPEIKMFNDFSQLNTQEYQAINKIIKYHKINISHLNTKSQQAVLNVALDYYNWQLIEQENKALITMRDKILIYRLTLPTSQTTKKATQILSPDKHPSPTKLSFYADDKGGYSEFSVFNRSLLGKHNSYGNELIGVKFTLKYNKKQLKFYNFDIVDVTKLNRYKKNFPQQQYSWRAKLGINNLNNLKLSATLGIGKVIFDNHDNLLYIMSSVLLNNTETELSLNTTVSIRCLKQNLRI